MYKGKYYRRSIYDLENNVKDIYYSDNPLDPSLYEAIRELSEGICVLKGYSYNIEEADVISHRVAEEIYTRLVRDKNFKVHAWTKYVRLRTLGVRGKYVKEVRKVALTTQDLLESAEVQQSIFSSARSLSTVDEVCYRRISELLEEIPDKIREIYDSLIRYKSGTEIYNKIYISVLMSIEASGLDLCSQDCKIVMYDKLPQYKYKSYVRFLVLAIYSNLRKYLIDNCELESFNLDMILDDLSIGSNSSL